MKIPEISLRRTKSLRKSAAIFGALLCGALFVPAARAAVQYERNPVDFLILNPVSFQSTVDSMFDYGWDPSVNYYSLNVVQDDQNFIQVTQCLATTELSISGSAALPYDTYVGVEARGYDDSNCAQQAGAGPPFLLEGTNDAAFPIFVVYLPYGNAAFSFSFHDLLFQGMVLFFVAAGFTIYVMK